MQQPTTTLNVSHASITVPKVLVLAYVHLLCTCTINERGGVGAVRKTRPKAERCGDHFHPGKKPRQAEAHDCVGVRHMHKAADNSGNLF